MLSQRNRERFEHLSRIARAEIPLLYDPDSALVARKIRLEDGERLLIGSDPFYSAVCLLGLLHDGSADAPAPGVTLGRALDALHAGLSEQNLPRLGGAVLWASATADDGRAVELLARISRSRFQMWSSMDLGLLLTGALSTMERFRTSAHVGGMLADAAAAELLDRFSEPAGLFEWSRPFSSPRSVLHRRLTSFASQVYPLHGLAHHAVHRGDAATSALATVARKVAESQGPLGQWWWLYSARSGDVVEGYPVYTVHQESMAFMGLLPVHLLGLAGFDEHLGRGLDWVFGQNELGRPLVSEEGEFISRCIQRVGSRSDGFAGISRADHVRAVLASFGFANPKGTAADPTQLEILRERWSYELGWLLYAGALLDKAA
jgi:hypothetical protein